jgi:hypothetical protein
MLDAMPEHASVPQLDFESARSARYRKVGLVLAFQSGDGFEFKKPWGKQCMPAGSWLIVPLRAGKPSLDLYGCHAHAFERTYRPLGDDRPHVYEKGVEVEAYQPGIGFSVRTIVAGHVEVDCAIGQGTDWLVKNPDGELYIISDAIFSIDYQML